jgi:hypothetical protein
VFSRILAADRQDGVHILLFDELTTAAISVLLASGRGVIQVWTSTTTPSGLRK